MVKTETAIASPVSDDDFEKFGKMSVGDVFRCEKWKERNYYFLRKYFALMNLTLQSLPEDFSVRKTVEKENGETYEHIEHIDTVDKLRWHVMIQAGFYEQKITLGGRMIYQIQSIAFDEIDDVRFSEIYEGCKNAIWRFFLPELDKTQRMIFEEQLLNF